MSSIHREIKKGIRRILYSDLMVTNKLTCVTHKCLPPLSVDISPSANSGSKLSRLLSLSTSRHLVESLESVDVKSNAINRRICIRYPEPSGDLFIFLGDETRNFSRGKIDPKFIQDESRLPAATESPVRRVFASRVIVIHPRSARGIRGTHARIQRVTVCAPTCVTSMYNAQRAPLDRICVDCKYIW